jgi:hypothetical protein
MEQFTGVVSSIARDLGGLFLGGHGPSSMQWLFIAGLGGFLGMSAIERRYKLLDRIWSSSLASVVFASALIVAMMLLGLPDGPQFIYFQF